ncbi:hypothetical protein NC651_010795 [Populus alba x Populus x berolinensis]|nr:hypothetical protein NC651_010795 [Populus alba x Populus x berolinensis]
MLLKQTDKNKDHLSDYDLFLGMFINETIDNKVRKTTCEEARKIKTKMCTVSVSYKRNQENSNASIISIVDLPVAKAGYRCAP